MSETKQAYKVLHPIGWSGRIERGEVVMMTSSEAANFPGSLMLETAVPVEEIKEPVPVSPDTELVELQAKAQELGLSTDGSKADLLERINLASVAPSAPVDAAAPEAPKPTE